VSMKIKRIASPQNDTVNMNQYFIFIMHVYSMRAPDVGNRLRYPSVLDGANSPKK